MDKRWEYRSILNPSDSDMDEFGEFGWELVAVTPSTSGKIGVVCYFKRELPSNAL